MKICAQLTRHLSPSSFIPAPTKHTLSGNPQPSIILFPPQDRICMMVTRIWPSAVEAGSRVSSSMLGNGYGFWNRTVPRAKVVEHKGNQTLLNGQPVLIKIQCGDA